MTSTYQYIVTYQRKDAAVVTDAWCFECNWWPSGIYRRRIWSSMRINPAVACFAHGRSSSVLLRKLHILDRSFDAQRRTRHAAVFVCQTFLAVEKSQHDGSLPNRTCIFRSAKRGATYTSYIVDVWSLFVRVEVIRHVFRPKLAHRRATADHRKIKRKGASD